MFIKYKYVCRQPNGQYYFYCLIVILHSISCIMHIACCINIINIIAACACTCRNNANMEFDSHLEHLVNANKTALSLWVMLGTVQAPNACGLS